MTISTAPRLSLGLPVRNGERFLDEVFRSLNSQDLDDFEVIVSDNASTDGTEDLCREWAANDARIRYRREPLDRGAGWNFNACVAEARGELFKWCADDDLLAPAFLSRCVEALDDDQDAVLAYTLVAEIDAAGAMREVRTDVIPVSAPRPAQRLWTVLREMKPCFAVFGVIRTSVLRRTPGIGPYSQSDRVLLAELALHGRWVRIPEHLFLHREHPGRSMRVHPDPRERTAWFDTSRRGRINLPSWRLAREYLAAVERVPLAWPERQRCRAVAARHVAGLYRGLTGDLVAAGRIALTERPTTRTGRYVDGPH